MAKLRNSIKSVINETKNMSKEQMKQKWEKFIEKLQNDDIGEALIKNLERLEGFGSAVEKEFVNEFVKEYKSRTQKSNPEAEVEYDEPLMVQKQKSQAKNRNSCFNHQW